MLGRASWFLQRDVSSEALVQRIVQNRTFIRGKLKYLLLKFREAHGGTLPSAVTTGAILYAYPPPVATPYLAVRSLAAWAS